MMRERENCTTVLYTEIGLLYTEIVNSGACLIEKRKFFCILLNFNISYNRCFVSAHQFLKRCLHDEFLSCICFPSWQQFAIKTQQNIPNN